MNTITTLDVTAIDTEEEAVPQHAGSSVRVAIREIREYAYRALVVAGASHGEAAAGAGQVVHAELYAGEGLAGLVLDLARDAWPREGPTCSRRSGARSVLEVECGERSGELRVGRCLIELAAGEAEPAVVTTAAVVSVNSILGEPMLAAATVTGTTVAAMQLIPRGPCLVMLATQEGNLAHGELDSAAIRSLVGMDDLVGLEGFIVITGVSATEASLTRLTWSTPAQRAERRRAAARYGVEVDGAIWQVVASHAQHFLVPEVGS